jgi:SAGA-associated factor 29
MPEEDYRSRWGAGCSDRYVSVMVFITAVDVLVARGDSPSSRIDAELDSNLRENIKLSEEMLTLIKSERGNDICEQLSILSALRSADTDSSTSRATNTGKSRDRQNKRKLTDATMDDRDSIAADSPVAPSPKIPGKERLLQKSGSSRAGSAVPTVREGSVKGEDESEHAKGKNTRSSASSTKKRKDGLR